MKKKIMFDCNAFEEIILDDRLELLVNTLDRYEYYIIPIQVKELHNIPDEKETKREKLIDLISKLHMKEVYISPAIYGTFKYGQAKYGGYRSVYDKVLFRIRSNTIDALIASSTNREDCIVITNDGGFRKKMINNNYPVMNFNEFIEDVKSNL